QAVLTGHTGWVRAVAWSPDGGRLASGGWGGEVRIWDLQIRKSALTFQHFTGGAWCIFTEDGAPALCHRDTWRWLRWFAPDPVTGVRTRYPAEYFGPLPGINPPS
ncbi:MAG: WD40 repeat domain-containing protein, partial [Actinomycetota bacterium]